MMTRDLLRRICPSIVAAVAIAVWGCSANAGMLLIDPAGDTFGDPLVEPQFDIATASTDLTASDITFSVTFFTPPDIALPSAMSLGSIEFRIDIDVDQDALTGGTSNLEPPLGLGVPLPGLGVEFYLELSAPDESIMINNGTVALLDLHRDFVSRLPVTLTPSSFSVTIPLTTLNLLAGQEVNFGVIVGPSGGNSASDQVTFPASTVVPEPASVATLLIGLGLVIGGRYSRRRTSPGIPR